MCLMLRDREQNEQWENASGLFEWKEGTHLFEWAKMKIENSEIVTVKALFWLFTHSLNYAVIGIFFKVQIQILHLCCFCPDKREETI